MLTQVELMHNIIVILIKNANKKYLLSTIMYDNRDKVLFKGLLKEIKASPCILVPKPDGSYLY